jgi:hypothetical protein
VRKRRGEGRDRQVEGENRQTTEKENLATMNRHIYIERSILNGKYGPEKKRHKGKGGK